MFKGRDGLSATSSYPSAARRFPGRVRSWRHLGFDGGRPRRDYPVIGFIHPIRSSHRAKRPRTRPRQVAPVRVSFVCPRCSGPHSASECPREGSRRARLVGALEPTQGSRRSVQNPGAPMPRNPRGSGGFVVLRSRHGNVYSGRSDFSEILRIAMATEELAEGAGLRSCRPAACGLRPAPRLSFPGPSSSPDAAEPAAVRVARRADRNGRRGAWPSRRLGRARGQGQAGHAGARSLASGTLMIPCSIIDRKGRCR